MARTHEPQLNRKGFTIVELLIVIVVIGILAAITLVAFNGISGRANLATVQQDLTSAAKAIENARTVSTSGNVYPANQAAAQTAGMSSTVSYTATSALGGFCAIKTVSSYTYMVTSANKTPHVGTSCTLTNFITNPSLETVATGWAQGTNSTVARSTTYASSGTASLLITHSNTTAGSAYGTIPMTGLTVGTLYSLSFDIRSTTGTPTVNASVRNGSATGTIPADSSSQSITPSTTFTRYTINFTAENASTYFVVDITGTTSGQAVAIDGVMAVSGQNADIYMDPSISSSTWTWTGTAHASTSTGPAF